MCTRLFYSVSGSSRNSLWVGYSDLCASVGCGKMRVVIPPPTVGNSFTYEHPGVGWSCACLIEYLD